MSSTIDVITYNVFALGQLEICGSAIHLLQVLVSNVGFNIAVFCVGNTSVYVVFSHSTSPMERRSDNRIKWSFNA